MLITIEGLDASGKTTQTHLLCEKLKQKGFNVHTLDFPQYENNVFGVILKKFLSNEFGDSVNFDPKLSALLFAGDRYESLAQLRQWLNEPNSVVVLNRYIPSNIAYNRAKRKTDEEIEEITTFIENLEYKLLGLPKSDLVIVLGSSSAITQARLRTEAERDGYENDAPFLDRVAEEYVKLQKKYSATWKWLPIEADESRERVHQRIWELFRETFL